MVSAPVVPILPQKRDRFACYYVATKISAYPFLLFVQCRFRSDRKSTRLNSSHSQISYAVFCLKKKKTPQILFLADLTVGYGGFLDNNRALIPSSFVTSSTAHSPPAKLMGPPNSTNAPRLLHAP